MSSYSTTLVESPSDSFLSAVTNDMSSHNNNAILSTSDSWVTVPMAKKESSRGRRRRLGFFNYDCPNQFSPAAVSKPIDITGAQKPLCMPGPNPHLPQEHPFTDHKVHCYKDDVTDYCRRESNGWEFMRQKRRESVESQVGRILDGSWELVAYGRAQHRQRKHYRLRENELEEIERYLNGETDLLGYLKDARADMDDEEEVEH